MGETDKVNPIHGSVLQNPTALTEEEIIQMFLHYDQVSCISLLSVEISGPKPEEHLILSDHMKSGSRCT